MENGASAQSGKVSDRERIDKATEYKNEGNKYFQEGNLRQAIGKYHRALLQVKGIGLKKEDILFGVGGGDGAGDLSDKVKGEISQIQSSCYNNLAASMLKQESPNYEKIIEYCNKVLEIQSTNEKALFRKGTALNNLHKFDETIKTLEPHAKGMTSLRNPLATAKEGQRLQGERLKKNLKGMFD